MKKTHSANSHNLYVTHQSVCPDCGGTDIVPATANNIEQSQPVGDDAIWEEFRRDIYDHFQDLTINEDIARGMTEFFKSKYTLTPKPSLTTSASSNR